MANTILRATVWTHMYYAQQLSFPLVHHVFCSYETRMSRAAIIRFLGLTKVKNLLENIWKEKKKNTKQKILCFPRKIPIYNA